MPSLQAPEEILSTLYRYLSQADKMSAEMLFKTHSHTNQFETFKRLLSLSIREVYNVGEYIVVFSGSQSFGDQVFVIGLDDNYNLFCHNLPERSLSRYNLKKLGARAVRAAMGFDYHVWEAKKVGLKPGIRIRLQGDIVVTIEKIFESDDDLFMFLYRIVLSSLANINSDSMSSILRSIILRKLKQGKQYCSPEEILEEIRGELHRLGSLALSRIVGGLKEIISKQIVGGAIHRNEYPREEYDLVEEIIRLIDLYVRWVIENICYFENILNVNVGNHHIKIIGVTERDLTNLLNLTPPPSSNLMRIYVLRPHTITAIHDEHRAASLEIPRCVLTIGTLRVGPLQVVRVPIEVINRIIRIKVVAIDICGIESWRVLTPEFRSLRTQGPALSGTELFVCRTIMNTQSSRVWADILLWYARPNWQTNSFLPACFYGARVCLIVVDLSDEGAVHSVPRYIEQFWRITRNSWPIIVVGYKTRGDLDYETSRILREYIRKISEKTVVPSRYVEVYGGNRGSVRNAIVGCIRDLINYFLSIRLRSLRHRQ